MSNTTTTTKPAVATMDIPAGTIHDASYETAAWYRTFEHEAQTVEVRLGGQFAVYTIVGRTTHEHFPTLFGGNATGGGTMGACDKPSTYGVQTHGYNAAEMVEAGDMVLTNGATIEESFFDHRTFCSGSITNYGEKIGARHSPCEHDAHEDAHGKIVTARSDRGNLGHGYAPGVTNRKRHIKIVAG
jgi:hypothetical protein